MKNSETVSLTTLQHSDRQNPQCAAELMATWDVLKQAGFLSLSAYLKAGFLLLAAFYDKSLTVSERAENAWTVFTFFTLWGEHSKKFNTSENFITRESFKDLITAANGLVLYFVDLICNHPKAPVVPWFLSSDHNEQLFARIRVGRHSGRRTQIDSTRVPEAMGRYNRLLEVENTLDVECGTSVHKTAHTRGKTLFRSEWSKHPEKKIAVDFGGSVKMSNLIQSLKRGSKIGEELFVSSSSYGSSYLSGDNGNVISERRRSLQFPLSYGSEQQSDDESDHESEDNFSDYEDEELVDSSTKVRIRGKEIDYRSAVTKYCNQGKTNVGAKSRRKRFFGLALDTSIGLYRPVCKGLAEPELCNAQEVQVGGTITGILITGKDEKRRRTVVQGKVLSISVKTSKASQRKGNARSGERRPAVAICIEHDMSSQCWVKTQDGSIISLDWENIHRN